MPPEGDAINDCDWPTYIVTEEGLMETVGDGLTLAVAVLDWAVFPTLSVTMQ